ncbi:endomucin-like isoform X2 [Xenopus laevis]|uniref:Endomucin-like isoform X2 n=1 Tax=Xenopus laevis TaxID=8355 RepID=A0A8J1M1L0_XENLA|nr:endomucin-like isoform X2 [Xenopus laevis]
MIIKFQTAWNKEPRQCEGKPQRTMKSPAAAVLFLVLFNLVLESDTTDPINTPTVLTPKQESDTTNPKSSSTSDDPTPKTDADSFAQPDATTATTITTTATAVNNTKTGAASTTVAGNTSITSTAGSITTAKNEVAIPTVAGNTSTDQTSVANNGSEGVSDSTKATPMLSTSVSRDPNTTKGISSTPSEGNSEFKGTTQKTGNTSLGLNDKSVLRENGENSTTKPSENDQTLKEMEQSSIKLTGLAIPLSCILVPILLVVAVCLYKMCQKKSPAAESTDTKLSAQNKESVKLLSVKSSATDSDLKRAMPSHNTEFIAEC